MRIWLKNPLSILIEESVDARGGIVIEGKKIQQIIAYDKQPSEKVDQIVDASKHVILPGLINTHHHFYPDTNTRIS